jgi:hypothetical protein
MMLGHALLAFAVAALLARWAGWAPRRAATLGVVAGAFAATPDADMAYAVTGLFGANVDSVFDATGAFWGTSTAVHRTMTHSLVVAVPAAAAFTGFAVRSRRRAGALAGAALATALVAVAYAMSGTLGGVIVGTFVFAGVGVGLGVRVYTDLDARTTFGAALFGLASHPFGDVVTGEPPALLYPLDVRVLDGRVALHDDATLHLLGAFAVELAVVWLALVAVARLRERELRTAVHPAAFLGVAYAGAVAVLPPPTLSLSYPFVFSILGVGTTLGTTGWVRGHGPGVLQPRRERLWRWAVTTTAAVTLALCAYAAGYLVL